MQSTTFENYSISTIKEPPHPTRGTTLREKTPRDFDM
jgi:hypothetical protein